MTSEDIKHQLIITKHNSLWGRSFGLGFRSSVWIVLICSVLVRNLIIIVIRDASKLSLGWCLDWAAVIITIIWQRWCWSWRWCWLSGRRCSWLGRKWAIEVIVAVTSNPFFIFIVVIKCVLGFGGCNRSSAFVFTLKEMGAKHMGLGMTPWVSFWGCSSNSEIKTALSTQQQIMQKHRTPNPHILNTK